MSQDNQDRKNLEKRLAELRINFLKSLPYRLTELAVAWKDLKTAILPEGPLRSMQGVLHNLAGAGGTFGFHEISQQARVFELALNPLIRSKKKLNREQTAQLQVLLKSLQNELKKPLQQHVFSYQNQPIIPSVRSPLRQGDTRTIILVDDDPLLVQELSLKLNVAGYQVKSFQDPIQFLNDDSDDVPSAIMMDMVFQQQGYSGGMLLDRYKQEHDFTIPMIVISVRNDVEARLEALRNGAGHYFTKPLHIQELIHLLDEITAPDPPDPYKILIVDDDPMIAEFYQLTLQADGMSASVITDPLKVLDRIMSDPPELILLDVNMPECDGLELAALIRQERKLSTIPIVFLSKNTTFRVRAHALEIGADDYLMKPIAPEVLIHSVRARAKRARDLQQTSKRLQENEQRMQNILQSVNDVIWSAQPEDNQLLFISDAVEKILGYSAGHFLNLGSDWRHFIHPEYVEKVAVNWKLLEQQQYLRLIYKVLRADGTVRWVEEQIQYLRNEEGVPTRIDGLIRDLTNQKEAEERILLRLLYEHEMAKFTAVIQKEGDLEKALKHLLRASDASRVYLFENYKEFDRHTCLRLRSEVVQDNVPQLIKNYELLRCQYDDLSFLYRELSQGKAINSLVENLPEAEQRMLSEHGVLAVLMIPVYVDNQWWGFIGFDECRKKRRWGHDDVSLLQSAADIVGSFLQHQEMMEENKYQAALLHSTAEIARLILTASDMTASINESVKLLGEVSESDGVFIFLNTPEECVGGAGMRQQYAWTRDEYWQESKKAELQQLDCLQAFPRWIRKLSKNEVIQSLVMRLPVDEREVLESLGISHILLVPFRTETEFDGFLTITHMGETRDWSDSTTNIIRTVAAILGGSLSREQTRQELAKAKIEAEQASQAKSSFLGKMSHEIKTPLNAITGFSRLLLEKETNEERQEFITHIMEAGDKLLLLVDDILDITKVDTGKTVLELVPFSLNELMDDLYNAHRCKAVEKQLDFQVSLPEDPLLLVGDPAKITQVLMNLLSNALKFTQKGFIKLAAREIARNGEQILLSFSVQDSGIGIDPSVLSTVFDAFQQGDSSLTRPYDGTGLGLTICKKLVQLMQGTIYCETKVGEGSTLICEIPLILVEESKPAIINEEKLVDKKILVVEDNLINQKLIVRLLEHSKLAIVVAENGKVALEQMKKHPDIDLILMDMHMPVMSGIEAVTEIRLHDEWNNKPVIALTASPLKEDIEKCLQAGMNDYLEKPVNSKSLLQLIHKWLRL